MTTEVEGIVNNGIFVKGKSKIYFQSMNGKIFDCEKASDEEDAKFLGGEICKLLREHSKDICCTHPYRNNMSNYIIDIIVRELVDTDLGLKLKTILDKI